MKIPVIKQLVENHSAEELAAAEAALMEGQPLPIAVGGDDEGEQLTHLLAAAWILDQVKAGTEFKDALRAYTQRVRNSIS